MLGLMDAGVEDRDLEEALADEVDWARRAGRLDVRLVVAGEATPLEPAQAREILRIAQEALTNIVQHADATLVRLGIAYESAGVSLLVQDDGRGFDAHTTSTDAGWGLQRMSDRARAVGGVVELDSVPGWGTSLRARFPHRQPRPAAAGRPLRVLVVDPQPLIRAGVAGCSPSRSSTSTWWVRPRAPNRRSRSRRSSAPTWSSRAFASATTGSPTASS